MTIVEQGTLNRFRDGILACAIVKVEVHLGEGAWEVTPALPPDDDVELEDVVPQEFVDAAIAGAARTIASLTQRARSSSMGKVKILQILSKWPDTKADAVECAAGMAVARALAPNMDVQFIYQGRWLLDLW